MLTQIIISNIVILGLLAWPVKIYLSNKIKEEIRGDVEKSLMAHERKLNLYTNAITPIIKAAAKISWQKLGEYEITKKDLLEFDLQRLQAHGELGLFAPMSVLEKYDKLIDYMGVYFRQENEPLEGWKGFRDIALEWVSEMRKDIAINTDNVYYTGNN